MSVAALMSLLIIQDPIGSWSVRTARDPITDATKATAVTRAENGSFVIQCEGGQPDSLMATWKTPTYLGDANSSRDRPAVYRLDDDEPVITRWTYIDDWAAIREGRDELLKNLRRASRAVFRGTTYRGDSVTLAVDVTGADQAIDAVLTACELSAVGD